MPPAKFLISLGNTISQYEEKISSNISIKVEGNVQGNIIVGDNNVAQIDFSIFEADKKAREQAELDRKAREKIEADKKAFEKAEADKKAREQAELDRKAREKIEADRKAFEKAEADKKAREQAELDRKAREIIEADKKARESAELDRKAREKVEADRKAREQIRAFPNTYKNAQPASKNWGFGTRQVVYGTVGAALYGVFSFLTNIFPLVIGNVAFRPAVGVLVFFAAAYGPWVGLLAGFIGNTLGDALSGWGFWWNWDLGYGLMGLVAGLVSATIKDFRAQGDIVKACGAGIAGVAIGMLFSSLTEMFTGGIDINTALIGYFRDSFISNTIVVVILVPVLMNTFAAVASRRGR